MDCVLAHLLACFSWSGLYVSGDLSVLDATMPRAEQVEYQTDHFGGFLETGSTWTFVDRANNPYGGLAIGYELRFRSAELAIEASHLSSIADNHDRGINAITLRGRWYPFR